MMRVYKKNEVSKSNDLSLSLSSVRFVFFCFFCLFLLFSSLSSICQLHSCVNFLHFWREISNISIIITRAVLIV